MNKTYFLPASCPWVFVVLMLVVGCKLQETEFINPVPVALEASDITSTSFRASWKPVLGSTRYLVDVATDPAFTYPVKGYQSLEIEGTTLLVTNLEAEQEYYYRVRAKKGNTFSGNSNVISSRSSLITAPVALTAAKKKVLQFTANWSSSEGAASYLVDVALDSTFITILPGYSGKETVDTSLTVTGLDFRQTYYYRVKAKRVEKLSAYSNTTQVKPVISPTCKLSKITVSTSSLTELNTRYDEQGRVTEITLSGGGVPTRTYTIHYDTKGNPTEVLYNEGGSGLMEKHERIYNPQGLLMTLIVHDETRGSITSVTDYTYNAKRQLIATKMYFDANRNTLADSSNYEFDTKGNAVKSRVMSIMYDYLAISELQYDAEFNPLLMIRPELHTYMNVLGRPIELQVNNPVIVTTEVYFEYFVGKEESSYEFNALSYYQFNEQGLLTRETGAYKVTYEYTGCDF